AGAGQVKASIDRGAADDVGSNPQPVGGQARIVPHPALQVGGKGTAWRNDRLGSGEPKKISAGRRLVQKPDLGDEEIMAPGQVQRDQEREAEGHFFARYSTIASRIDADLVGSRYRVGSSEAPLSRFY